MSYRVRPEDVATKSGAKSSDGTGLNTAGLGDQVLIAPTGQAAGFTGTKQLKLIQQVYETGGTHKLHSHPVAEQAYYIVRGRAHVRVGEETFEVEAGTTVYIPPGVEHEMANIGDEPLVNLLIDVALDA